MTLLSSPQGTPERVWSLLAGLAALGGKAPRAQYDALLNPGFGRDGVEVKAKASLAADAHNAASSLGLVDVTREEVAITGSLPPSYAAFADLIHDRLSESGGADATILEGYAWMMAESEREGGVEWIYQCGRDAFADQANAGLAGQEMNSTRLPAWRRWLSFLGLGVTMPHDRSAADYPTPAARLARELERAGIAAGASLGASDFLGLLARRMPYLDRGRLFAQACQRIGHVARDGRLSPLLSVALRELHDERSIQLLPSGDASERIRLVEDSAHPIDAFTTVVVFPGTPA